MITSTHLILGNILYGHLSSKYNYRLNRFFFMLGAIKPDYKNNEIELPHYLEDSVQKISEFISSLSNEKMSLKKFSLGLGIVSHYICDYFCMYHDEEHKDKGSIEHYLYETVLHAKVIRLLLRGDIQIDANVIPDNFDVEILLRNITKNYEKEKICMERDINYALYASTIILNSIVSSYANCNSSEYIERDLTKIAS